MLFLPSILGCWAALLVSTCRAEQPLVRNVEWGRAPTQVNMYVREPKGLQNSLQKGLQNSPSIVVLIHGCLGSAQGYHGTTRDLHPLADLKNIVLIYPDTSFDSHCWDVASSQSLTRDGGSDSQSIANMVRHALQKYNGNPEKVFVSGWSSGGMMTNVLAATYPDMFKGAASISGTPHGCLAQPNATSTNRHSSPGTDKSGCPQGLTSKSGAQWAELVRSAYPGYNGPRPKIQLWHGTADAIVSYKCLGEAVKQWSTVLNVQFSQNISSDPTRGYTKAVYGDGSKLVAYSGSGVGHMDISSHGAQILEFFGL